MGDTQTERDIRANKPFTLFEVEGKKYRVKVLSINRADDWLVLAGRFDVANLALDAANSGGDAEGIRKARKAFNEALYDAVFAYDEEALPREALEDEVTPAQMVDAFYRLRAYTDPFERAQTKAMEELRAKMKGLPESIMETAMAVSIRKAAAS